MMTAAEIRLKQNPILSSLLLGMGQGSYIAEKLFPRLPQSLAEGDDLCYLNLSGVPMVRRIVLVWRAQSNRQACLMSILGVLREFH